MISNRSQPLGGEGCPAADITTPAEKRNNYDVSPEASRRFMQNDAGTNQPSWHTHDTRNQIPDLRSFTGARS